MLLPPKFSLTVPLLCLCPAATVFGQNLRLEPLLPEKKSMWRREMDCLLTVCNYIVEFIPSCQIYQDDKSIEVRIIHRPTICGVMVCVLPVLVPLLSFYNHFNTIHCGPSADDK
uniref:PRONE domain-containing protein n=1 Tax=Nelumbo nucifera TaxID=4432 RepID=A0A822XG95_NELNU|nr:TPA_asm: hypothetical protein HUJ06_020395 [Nelumbo nucifera]